MFLVLIGPPGSGKGTQAKIVAQKLNFLVLSTGDVLRREVQNKSEIGKEIEATMNAGGLVPDSLINDVVKNYLVSNIDKNIILDGFPRTAQQAAFVYELFESKLFAINLEISDDALIKRIVGRFSCSKCGEIYNDYFRATTVEGTCDKCGSQEFNRRSDDKEETVKNRLVQFHKNADDVIKFFTDKSLLKSVSAQQDVEKIAEDISAAIKNR